MTKEEKWKVCHEFREKILENMFNVDTTGYQHNKAVVLDLYLQAMKKAYDDVVYGDMQDTQ